jgi:hypothetical protein
MPTPVTCPDDIQVGEIYEDCSYHPVLCTEKEDGVVGGISLIDGTMPRHCSTGCCGLVKLSLEEAVARKEKLEENTNA